MAVSIASALVAAGMGTYQALKAADDQKRARAAADGAINGHPNYEPSPFDREMLADARGRVGAASSGILQSYQRILQNAANRRAFAQRNGTSGASVLAEGANADADAQGALADMGTRQDTFNQQQLGNYYAALERMSKQHLLGYEGAMAKYGDNLNYTIGRVGAANQNLGQGLALTVQGLGSLASTYGKYQANRVAGGKRTAGPYAGNMSGLAPNGNAAMSYSPLVAPALQSTAPVVPGAWMDPALFNDMP